MDDDSAVNGTTFVEEPMRPVRVRAMCGCGNGELKSTGEGVSTGFSSKWWHKCTRCGATVVLDKSYPRIEFRDVEAKNADDAA